MDAAVHEAGHAVARWWCGVPLRLVAALPDGTGITAAAERPIVSVTDASNADEFHRLATVAYAGAVSEAMVTGVNVDVLWRGVAVYDAAKVSVAAYRLFLLDDVTIAKQAAMRTAILIFKQPLVLTMAMAVAGLIVKRRAVRGVTVLNLLDDTIGQRYPRRHRERLLFTRHTGAARRHEREGREHPGALCERRGERDGRRRS